MSKQKSTSTKTDEIKSILGTLKDLEDSRTQLNKQLEKAGSSAVKVLEKLVKSNPHILAFRWNQYTPHFNDGDTCEFSVNELEVKFDQIIAGKGDVAAKKRDEEDEDEDDNGEWVAFGEYGEDLKEYFNERKDVLNFEELDKLEGAVASAYEIHEHLQRMDDALLQAFGDDAEVTVTREGIETDEYEHD